VSNKRHQTWSDWNGSWGVPVYVFGGMAAFIAILLALATVACGDQPAC
jgi:hypothetical protein